MKINRKFNTILLALVMVFIAFTTNAKAGEVYTAVARGYYDHPVTHVIEDPGNNPGIGEGMVNNVVYGVALIEKDDDGSYMQQSGITLGTILKMLSCGFKIGGIVVFPKYL